MLLTTKQREKVTRCALRAINAYGTYNVELTCLGKKLAHYTAKEREKIAAAVSVGTFDIETADLRTGELSYMAFTWWNDAPDCLVSYGVSLEIPAQKVIDKLNSFTLDTP